MNSRKLLETFHQLFRDVVDRHAPLKQNMAHGSNSPL